MNSTTSSSTDATAHQNNLRVVLVTGPSGAGRSTAINALEDAGYEAIDNLPLSLVPRLLEGAAHSVPLALGIDARNRDFSASGLIELIETLASRDDVSCEVLYLDCSKNTLIRRFSETRRRHPLAPAEEPGIGIEREFDLLKPILVRADVLIDTTEFSPHDLRAEVEQWFAPKSGQKLAVSIHSFSYKRGVPRGIDMIFDVRFLRNPYWDESLRSLDGRDARVASYVEEDERFDAFFVKIRELCEMLLPAYIEEGKTHFSIGFGCTGGQHRSVTVTEKLANALAEGGWQVSIRHREMERRAVASPDLSTGKLA
ncbi:RNase adapter RapZ [Halocynthiibacter sp. C4]|uniref:RNase adapter RapZ n=1 Tax=Halocynthiibacter sp. C4 TaxID=2992758 RepID=UPI00237AD2CA|nr:RNase adapter RapZ [Halocynthiibacter sp. C4]MDE0588417.1 RNase adapter RapZ [Halocynthiibacter sp. C4]